MKHSNDTSFRKLGNFVLIVVQFLILIGIVGGVLYLLRYSKTKQPGSVAQVGKETLYTQDILEYKKKNPSLSDEDLLQKAVLDSVILQEGEKAGLITLTPSTFNNTTKDQSARDATVHDVKTKYVQSQSDLVSGMVITLWFARPGMARTSLATNQAQALAKITPYYEKVKNRTMTIQDAANAVRTDQDLSSIDPAYETNTSFTFVDQPLSTPIVADSTFDQQLKQLPQNEVSTLYLTKTSLDGKEQVDGGYLFGMLTDRKQNQHLSFDEWILSKRNSYEVVKL